MNTSQKGDLAEIKVATDLVEKGYIISFPHNRCDYDLIADTGSLLRIQVKYVSSNGESILVDCSTRTRTSEKKYINTDIDYIAVYDSTTDKCYYIPRQDLGSSEIRLRLTLPKNNVKSYKFASNYLKLVDRS